MHAASFKVKVGITSLVGWALAAAGLIPIVAKVIQSGANITVSGPERWFAIGAIAIGGVTQVGRYLQSVTGISQNVKVKITTVVGWLSGLVLLYPVIEKSYSEGVQVLHSPEKYAAIGGIAFALITQIARYVQAAGLGRAARA